MIVQAFLDWYDSAGVAERAEAVSLFAQTMLAGHLGGDSPAEAEAALLLALDDPNIAVRAALAEAVAGAGNAPRTLILCLAYDQPAVAAPVLACSPLLTDADLIDCATLGDGAVQKAIAQRHGLSDRVTATLGEVAAAAAITTLIENPDADIADFTFSRIVTRFGDDPLVREALLAHPDLPLQCRQRLMRAVSEALLKFVAGSGLMPKARAERMVEEARQSATLALTRSEDDLDQLVHTLVEGGDLTPGLLLRGLLCGDTTLFAAALVELTGIGPKRIAAILRDRAESAVVATLRRAGLPERLEPAFVAAVRANRVLPVTPSAGPRDLKLKGPIIREVIIATASQDEPDRLGLISLLRRLESEALREEAREALRRRAALPPPAIIPPAHSLMLPERATARPPSPQQGGRPIGDLAQAAVAQALLAEAPDVDDLPSTVQPKDAPPFGDWNLRAVA